MFQQPVDNTYRIRKVAFNGRRIAVICQARVKVHASQRTHAQRYIQNTNGPSPLIALCNVLLLNDKLRCNDITSITTDELILNISDVIFNNVPNVG